MQTIEEKGRGVITFVSDAPWKSTILISSEKGAKRANHYHTTDTHLMHIISGKARYVERGLDDHYGYAIDRVVGPGDQILTGPNVAHAMEFLEDSLMLVLSVNERDPAQYLKEIVPCKIL
jgi:quercetin dioxygenase-like cupin family protein